MDSKANGDEQFRFLSHARALRASCRTTAPSDDEHSTQRATASARTANRRRCSPDSSTWQRGSSPPASQSDWRAGADGGEDLVVEDPHGPPSGRSSPSGTLRADHDQAYAADEQHAAGSGGIGILFVVCAGRRRPDVP